MIALALVVLSFAPETQSSLAPPPELPHVMLSTAPLTSLGLLAGSSMARVTSRAGGPDLWLPLGLEFPLSASSSIHVELAAAFGWNAAGAMGWGVVLEAGPTWYLQQREEPLTGFFIGPRFQFQLGKRIPPNAQPDVIGDFGDGPIDLGAGIRRAFLAGAEIGYQFRYQNVVFGPVFGVSAGLQFDSDSWVASPLEGASIVPRTVRGIGAEPRPSGGAIALNLNLFRLGISL